MSKDIPVRDYFEKLGYTVQYIGPGQPIRVYDAKTGHSAMIMPGAYEVKNGRSYVTASDALAVSDTIRSGKYTLPGYEAKTPIPEPKPLPATPVLRKPPNFIPESDWLLVNDFCVEHNVDPYFIAAVGWFETNWGRAGAGRQGYILGVGVLASGKLVSGLAGISAQLRAYINTKDGRKERWIRLAGEIVDFNVTYDSVLRFGKLVQQPLNPESWAKGVWSIYQQLVKGVFQGEIRSSTAYLSGMTPGEVSVDPESLNPSEEMLKEGDSLRRKGMQATALTNYLKERMGAR